MVPLDLVLQPRGDLMFGAPIYYQVHVMIGLTLFCLAVHRLVHAFSAPIGYLFRPYIVYRSRGGRPSRRAHRFAAAPPRLVNRLSCRPLTQVSCAAGR